MHDHLTSMQTIAKRANYNELVLIHCQTLES